VIGGRLVTRHLRNITAPAAGLALGVLTGGYGVSLHAAAPNVSIASPAPGAIVRGTVSLVARADGEGLASLQFRVNGAAMEPRITSGPCAIPWDSTRVADGTHQVSAFGANAAGETITAPDVTVIVANQSGTLSAQVAAITPTTAVVQWSTPVPTDGRVEYGTTAAYGGVARDWWGPASSHSVRLTGLSPSTAYHYRVVSTAGPDASYTSFDAVFVTAAASGADQAAGAGGAAAPASPESGTPPAEYPRQLSAAQARALLLAHARGDDFVPGEVLVKFRPGVTRQGQQRALMALRSRPSADALDWRGDVAVLRDALQPDARILAQQLREQPEVQYAEPNYLYRFRPRRARETREPVRATGSTGLTPNDSAFGDQWNFTAIDLPRAWDIQPGGRSDFIVAVVDSGVTTVNQSFTFPVWNGSAIQQISIPYAVSPDLPASRLVSPRDFVFGASGAAVLDMDGHGTHVASTLAEETNNAFSLAGVAYNVRIMPVKACLSYWDIQITMSADGVPGFTPPGLSFCPSSAVAQGIRYAADNGAKVINVSLGGTSQSLTVREAIIYATGRGAFVAIANGNDFEDGNPVNYPAADAGSIGGAMAVAATNRSTRRAGYSGTGSHTEIAAPGGDFDDGGLDGLIWQLTLDPDDNDSFVVIFPRFDRYAEVGFQGTSSATPHVAGVAALIMSQGITDPALVERILTATARDLGASGRDNDFGYGLLQARRALFGFGIRK
jgi:serine protease